MWGATCLNTRPQYFYTFQSTHPVWGATAITLSGSSFSIISIHAPCVGCDALRYLQLLHLYHFNPRTLCGVRHTVVLISPPISDFNPRTLCGVRLIHYKKCKICWIFQSTHPVWGATKLYPRPQWNNQISIHAPCVGCDFSMRSSRRLSSDFNPRTLCGVRPTLT